jgi:hypothetical protein
MKTNKSKELFLEQLKQTPIIEVACKKTSMARATYYHLRKNDPKFAELADLALSEGKMLINDLGESQLISGMKDGNMTAIIFWLKNNHLSYKQKGFQSGFSVAEDDQENMYLEVFGKLKPETERLIEPYLEIINKNQDGTDKRTKN